MDDQEIIKLYWDRNQDAIHETQNQYGRYCHAISLRIVCNQEDADECVNDTWLRAWQAIPPELPQRLRIWLGRITRNLSINRLEANTAGKRGGGQIELSFDELESCLSGSTDSGGNWHIIAGQASELLEAKELAAEISSFLRTVSSKKRIAFVGRYYYFIDLDELADRIGMRKASLSVLLHRTRQDLMRHLRERGYEL